MHLQDAPLQRAGFVKDDTTIVARVFHKYNLTNTQTQILMAEMGLKTEPQFIRFSQAPGGRANHANLRAFDEEAVEIGEVYNCLAIDTVKKVRDCKQ